MTGWRGTPVAPSPPGQSPRATVTPETGPPGGAGGAGGAAARETDGVRAGAGGARGTGVTVRSERCPSISRLPTPTPSEPVSGVTVARAT